jgi:hypothetical protein
MTGWQERAGECGIAGSVRTTQGSLQRKRLIELLKENSGIKTGR